MLQDKKAVLFDLDGTLIDSMWVWSEIDKEYLGRFKLEPPKDLATKIEGMTLLETAYYFKKQFPITDSVDEMVTIWNEMAYDKYKNHIPLKPYVKDFLDFLMKKKIKMGIGTSNSLELTKVALQSLGIIDYFQTIQTASHVCAGKPAPDIYLLVAKELKVKPEECIVFEDVPSGILAGKRANMTTCGVYDQWSRELTEKKKDLADYYIHSYKELLMSKEK